MAKAGTVKVRIEAQRERRAFPRPGVHPSAVVEWGAEIGPRTTVGPNAYIARHVTIGADCRIGPGACIGQDGFGYTLGDGRWVDKPQASGVVIADDVHIGANTCIDRGSYRPTHIGEGTRIDNLVHIAHNVEIGRRCLVIAHAEISGSVEIGDDCWIAPAASIREHIDIGDASMVGIGSVVVHHVEPGAVVYGVPARPR